VARDQIDVVLAHVSGDAEPCDLPAAQSSLPGWQVDVGSHVHAV